ncbi:MAG: hypothetical protein JOZ25_12560 [Actinobacteria bacterium]|nr:hypothetical protein [Actinomycetota bacterium]
MRSRQVRPIGRGRLLAISAAGGLVVAGLAFHGSSAAHAPTFRDAAYPPAPKHHVKLTGIVSGTVSCTSNGKASECTKISIRKGKKAKKKVGGWTLGPFGCAGVGPNATCDTTGGSGNMKVGALKGKVTVDVRCAASDTGTLSQTGKKQEVLTFNKCPNGRTKGDKFKFTLGY